jgi:hypothetical protein
MMGIFLLQAVSGGFIHPNLIHRAVWVFQGGQNCVPTVESIGLAHIKNP